MIDDLKNGIFNSEILSYNRNNIKIEDIIELDKNNMLSEHVLY